MKYFTYLLVLCASAAVADSGLRPCLNPGSGVALIVGGTLRSEKHWGPPNFGESPETDSTFTAWILERSAPIGFAGGKALDRIQLHPRQAAGELKSLEGQVVLAKGSVWPTSAPADVTPLIISAESVSAANDSAALDYDR